MLASGATLVAAGLALRVPAVAATVLLPLLAAWKGRPPAPHWGTRVEMLGAAGLVVGAGNLALLAWRRRHPPAPVATFLLAWLPRDWYLNLDPGYRRAFNAPLGVLVSLAGFAYGAYVGRLLVWGLLAAGVAVFVRAFGLRSSSALLAFMWFLFHQSLAAGEWMACGVDTKTVAYACVLLACAAAYGRRYALAFATAGAALSFHVLVGFYAGLVLLVTLLLTGEVRRDWRRCLRHVWLAPCTGILGLLAIVQQLQTQRTDDAARAWDLFVRYRVPHHVLPSSWPDGTWVGEILLACGFFLVLYVAGRCARALRFLGAYGLAAAVLFGIGLAFHAAGAYEALRFFWFRFPDTMVPFLGAMGVALVLTHLAARGGPGGLALGASRVLAAAPLVFALATTGLALERVYALQVERAEVETTRRRGLGNGAVFAWIARHTPTDAVFLVDPTMSDFYLEAERAMLVTFRFAPNRAPEVLEWYARLVLLNGGREPARASFDSLPELREGFRTLSPAAIRAIARAHDLTFHVGPADLALPFPRVYADGQFAVHRIDGG